MKDYFGYKVFEDGTIIGIKGKILKPQKVGTGYYKVKIKTDNGIKYQSVHRIVAICYIDNPENKSQVNHKNGIKADNSVNNLEWCTPMENINHAYRNNLKNNYGEKNGASKLTQIQVDDIRRLYKNGGHSYRSLSKKFNVHFTLISAIIKNRIWLSENCI